MSEVILDSLNPTGSVFAEYNPAGRVNIKLGKNITTLDKTSGKDADDIVTIYRGAIPGQKDIVPGDFITTNEQLAKDYAGTGNVISKKVKASDILDDLTEPLGEEYIYRPQFIIRTVLSGKRRPRRTRRSPKVETTVRGVQGLRR